MTERRTTISIPFVENLNFDIVTLSVSLLTTSIYSLRCVGCAFVQHVDSIVCYLIDCLLCPCIYHIVCMYPSVRSSHDCYLIRGVCLCVSAAYPAAYGQISQAFPHPPPIIPQQQREGNAHTRHAPKIFIHATNNNSHLLLLSILFPPPGTNDHILRIFGQFKGILCF